MCHLIWVNHNPLQSFSGRPTFHNHHCKPRIACHIVERCITYLLYLYVISPAHNVSASGRNCVFSSPNSPMAVRKWCLLLPVLQTPQRLDSPAPGCTRVWAQQCLDRAMSGCNNVWSQKCLDKEVINLVGYAGCVPGARLCETFRMLCNHGNVKSKRQWKL